MPRPSFTRRAGPLVTDVLRSRNYRHIVSQQPQRFNAVTTSLTPFAPKSGTLRRKSHVKSSQRADFSWLTPAGSERTRRLHIRGCRRARSPAVWPPSKSPPTLPRRREDASLPGGFLASAGGRADHAPRSLGARQPSAAAFAARPYADDGTQRSGPPSRFGTGTSRRSRCSAALAYYGASPLSLARADLL
jgi:hypothetical protein